MSKVITSMETLLDRLKLDRVGDLVHNERAMAQFTQLARDIDPELLGQVIATVPAVCKTLTAVIMAMKEVGASLEKTKRARWNMLQAAAESGLLTGDQIVEMMRLIAEIDEKERIDWNLVFKNAMQVLGVTASVVCAGLLIVLAAGRGGDSRP